MSKTYFIADLHLSESRPHLMDLFRYFMNNIASKAEALYVLGDLFDFWIGDDEQSPLIDEVKKIFQNLTALGVKCYFIHGNRDFLIGKKFADECGLILLPTYHVIDLYGVPTLLCHGDTLCVDDKKYQRFRKIVHKKWLQKLFLCLPLKLRLNIAQKIRAKSTQDKKSKSVEIMDVNKDFVGKIVEEYDVVQVIHGHTHRQKIHLEQEGYSRVVLGDWREYAFAYEAMPERFQMVCSGTRPPETENLSST